MELVQFNFRHNGDPCWINPEAVEGVYGYEGKTHIAVIGGGEGEQYVVAQSVDEVVAALTCAKPLAP